MKRHHLLNLALVLLCVGLSASTRFFSEIPNFTPMLSIALFSGFIFKNRLIGFGIPVAAQFFSDIYFGFHESMVAVYLSFAFIALLGSFVSGRNSFLKSIAASFGGAFVFFIVTNLSVFLFNQFNLYPMTLSGLLTCYEMAIPFFRNTLLSSVIFSTILFGAYSLIESRTGLNLKIEKVRI